MTKRLVGFTACGVALSLFAPGVLAADKTAQYIGGGLQYGVLSSDGRSENRDTLMIQGRIGFNLDRNWVLELEAGLSPESSKTVSDVCIEGRVTWFNTSGDDVVCHYEDSFSRQSLRLNAMYRYPVADTIDIFAAFGLGVIRTDFDFLLDSASFGDETYSASEVNNFLVSYNLSVPAENELTLASVGETSGSSVDFAYALEVGTEIDDQHRIGLSLVPEYGNDEIGNFSYVGVSYAWLYRFDPF